MTRRLVSAVVFVALPLAAMLTVAQTRIDRAAAIRSGPSCPSGPSGPLLVGPAARRARQERRRLHRLLPVRLRRLDREEPGAAGSRELGPLRRAAGAQQRRRCTRILERRGRGTRPGVQEDRRLLRVVHRRNGDRRQGRRAARSAAEEDRGAVERQTISRRWSPSCTRSASTCSSSSARRPTSRTRRWRWRIADQGGLGLPDRDYYFRDDAKSVELRTQYVDHVAKMSALLGAAARSGEGVGPAGHDDRDGARQGRARRGRRAAIRTRSTTRCRTPSCRR